MKQEESSLRTKEEVDIRKIRKNKKWWKNYRNAKLKMRLWYERKDVKLCRRRRRRMGIETYVISKQWCSSFAHTINTFTYTCGSEELRKTSGRERGKSLWTKTLNRFLGDLPILYAFDTHSLNGTFHPLACKLHSIIIPTALPSLFFSLSCVYVQILGLNPLALGGLARMNRSI